MVSDLHNLASFTFSFSFSPVLTLVFENVNFLFWSLHISEQLNEDNRVEDEVPCIDIPIFTEEFLNFNRGRELFSMIFSFHPWFHKQCLCPFSYALFFFISVSVWLIRQLTPSKGLSSSSYISHSVYVCSYDFGKIHAFIIHMHRLQIKCYESCCLGSCCCF